MACDILRVIHLLFQSTFLREERQFLVFIKTTINIFQSTFLREERQLAPSTFLSCLRFQSTFLREERLRESLIWLLIYIISIHVPTRGTTALEQTNNRSLYISIHVPTRGTTILFLESNDLQGYFNPRSYERNDVYNETMSPMKQKFQSTFLREERPASSSAVFNASKISIHVPTRGTTFTAVSPVRSSRISIHVPTRGTTCAALLRRIN